MPNRTRILIVDDAAPVCHLLAEVVSGDVELEVAAIANNGREALRKFIELRPDAVLLDVDMPVMNGLDALTEIRKLDRHVPVLMFSALTRKAAAVTIDALLRGATTYIPKPSFSDPAAVRRCLREELIPAVKAICQGRILPRTRAAEPRPSLPARPPASHPAAVQAVVIGGSTGATEALSIILPQLAADLPVPVFVVQHMPPMFVPWLAERLDHRCALRVAVAEPGRQVYSGEVRVAGGDRHTVFERRGTNIFVMADHGPPVNRFRPSVDVLFRSAAEVYGDGTLGIVLSGMGEEGCRGSEAIVSRAGRVLVQDEDSSVVWGMPGSVVKAGLAEEIVSVQRMALHILQRVFESRSAKALIS